MLKRSHRSPRRGLVSPPTKQSATGAEALGCGLLLMGLAGGVFGLAALLGISDRVELEFFGIELNDTVGQLIWVTGSLAAVAVGGLILRARSRTRR